MKKFKLVIINSAILVIIGIGLTIYESQLINENVTNQQQNLLAGASMTLTKDLDPSNNKNGVYSIQITDFQESDNIKMILFNPVDDIITSKLITKNPLQENFLISNNGTYKIRIENQGQQEVQILAAIGNYPQNISLIDMVGFIMLITGLSGLAIGTMYFIKNRNENSAS